LKVNQIRENLKSLSTETRDILSKEQNTDKVQEFLYSLRTERVGNKKVEFENINGFQNIVKPIKDKAYDVTQQIKDKLYELDQRFGQLTSNSMLVYNLSEKQIQFNKVLEKYKEEVKLKIKCNSLAKIHKLSFIFSLSITWMLRLSLKLSMN